MTITATRPGHVLNPRALFIGGAGGVEVLHPYLEAGAMVFETAPQVAK